MTFKILLFVIIPFAFACSHQEKAETTILEIEEETPYEFQFGDIVFQTSLSSQSEAIQLATYSEYSHVGVLFSIDEEVYVLEAVQPVKLTLLEEWAKRGVIDHYVVKRLKEDNEILKDNAKTKMFDLGKSYIGRNYDAYFGWDDENLYCSELVWKLYNEVLDIELSELKHLSDFDLSSDVVKAKIEERYSGKAIHEEPVIAPSDLFNSSLLETVYTLN